MRNIILLICLWLFLLPAEATTAQKTFKGYWIYGFEQSLLQTCKGELYWMWVPHGFRGKYSLQGTKNPVEASGVITKANPEQNMGSSLAEFRLDGIRHIKDPCGK